MHEASVILHASLVRGRALRSPVARPTVPIAADRAARIATDIFDPPTETIGWLRANTGGQRLRKLAVVIACFAEACDIAPDDVIANTRRLPNVSARQGAMWVLHKAGVSFMRLGRDFGRDHATAINACRVVDAALGPRVFDDDALIADVAREVITAMADRRRGKETER